MLQKILQMIGRLGGYAIGIAVIATVAWVYLGEPDFERAAAQTDIHYALQEKCPLAREATRTIDAGMLSICSMYGLSIYESARRYPEIAPDLFKTYGGMPEFEEILDQYGHIVLPITQYFRERNSREFRFRSKLRDLIDRFGKIEPIENKPVELTPDQHGVLAIYEIKRRGHGLLAEFELVDGDVKRKQVRRAISLTTDFFTTGITDLEKSIVRGEKPTWKQVGWATLDAAVIFGGAAGLINSVRAAKATKIAGVASLKARTATVLHTIKVATKVGVVAGGTVTAIAVISNPNLALSGAGWIAENVFGLPKWAGGLFVFFILGAALVTALELINKLVLRPLTWPIRVGYRFAQTYRRRHPKPETV